MSFVITFFQIEITYIMEIRKLYGSDITGSVASMTFRRLSSWSICRSLVVAATVRKKRVYITLSMQFIVRTAAATAKLRQIDHDDKRRNVIDATKPVISLP